MEKQTLNEMSYFDLCALARTKGFDEDVPYIVTDEARQRLIAFLTPPKLPTEERPQHSPLPWRREVHPWHGREDGRLVIVSGMEEGESLYVVCADEMEIRREQALLDYDLIVSAVNASPAVEGLVEAARELIEGTGSPACQWCESFGGSRCTNCTSICRNHLRKALAPFSKQE